VGVDFLDTKDELPFVQAAALKQIEAAAVLHPGCTIIKVSQKTEDAQWKAVGYDTKDIDFKNYNPSMIPFRLKVAYDQHEPIKLKKEDADKIVQMKDLLKHKGDFELDVVFPVELQPRKDDGENSLFTFWKAIKKTMGDGTCLDGEDGSILLTEDTIDYSEDFQSVIKKALGYEPDYDLSPEEQKAKRYRSGEKAKRYRSFREGPDASRCA
jgi:hypothetical protein